MDFSAVVPAEDLRRISDSSGFMRYESASKVVNDPHETDSDGCLCEGITQKVLFFNGYDLHGDGSCAWARPEVYFR